VEEEIMKLEGKVALITGAGSGFGRATAILFAKEGARVVVVDLNPETGTQTVDLIKKDGNEASFVQADVSKSSDVEEMIRAAKDRYGRLDILYNNAGMPMANTPIEYVNEEIWDRIMEVNAKSIFLGAKFAVPLMKEQGGGVILSTSSVSGVRPRPGLSVYTASKAAASWLTRSLSLELAPKNIRVNCISPVAADTPMLPGFVPEKHRQDMDRVRKATVATIPMGRLADVEDVAKAALYLASDDAAFVTGVDLYVDGGRSL